MTPLGASVWQMASGAPTLVAGSRLFVDVTAQLRSPSTREATLGMMGRSDPRMRDALQTALSAGHLDIPADAGESEAAAPTPRVTGKDESPDPAIVPQITEAIERSLTDLESRAATATGEPITQVIRDDLAERLVELRDRRSSRALMTAFEATFATRLTSPSSPISQPWARRARQQHFPSS